MTALQIRDLPEEIYEKIKELSEQEHRSLSSQVLTLLEQSLQSETNETNRTQLIKSIKQQQSEWSRELPEPSRLISEDRNR